MRKPTPLYLLPREVDAVRAGAISRVIRPCAPCQPGDRLSVRRWTGVVGRSKYETLFETRCAEAQEIVIFRKSAWTYTIGWGRRSIREPDALDAIAQSVGFVDWSTLADHYREHDSLPWHGYLVGWRTPLWPPSPPPSTPPGAAPSTCAACAWDRPCLAIGTSGTPSQMTDRSIPCAATLSAAPSAASRPQASGSALILMGFTRQAYSSSTPSKTN